MTRIAYLQGDPEDFDDTLRHYIAKNWISVNTKDRVPKFQSGHGYDQELPTIEPVSGAAWQAFTGQDLIMFRESDNEISDMDNFRTEHITIVDVGVYAESPILRRLFCQEVNRILLSNVPNKGTRVPKATPAADGSEQNSAIAYFDTLQIAFTPVAAYEDVGTTWSSHGSIGCKWYEMQ